MKEQMARAFVDRARALGPYEREAGLPIRLAAVLAKKLTVSELNDLLLMLTVDAGQKGTK